MQHYCYDDQQNWNSRYVLRETLKNYIAPNNGYDEAVATAGYEVDPSNREGRHFMGVRDLGTLRISKSVSTKWTTNHCDCYITLLDG